MDLKRNFGIPFSSPWGWPAPHHGHHQGGFCPSCCHPVSSCCCNAPGCYRVPKELLAEPDESGVKREVETSNAINDVIYGTVPGDHAIIGGHCCVHLSIEYRPSPGNPENPVVRVRVMDAEGTLLTWEKRDILAGYHIKEGIITTNPGAILTITVNNAIARVRWCEIFRC